MACNIIISNQTDDEDHDFDIDDESFDDFGDTGSEKKKGIPKIAIIIGVILVIVFVVFLFGGSSEQAVDNSVVRGGSDVKQDVGTQELDPAMLEATQTLNEDNRMDAEDTGTSFIPIPTVAAQDSFAEIEEQEEEDDPLETWKSMQSERMRQEQFEREVREQQVVTQKESTETNSRQQVVTQLATAMSTSLATIIEGMEIKPLSHNVVTNEESFFEKIQQETLLVQNEQLALAVGEEAQIIESSVLIPATTIEYGQTLIEANSDVPGPVLAEMVTGPLSGARLLGSFSVENDYLVITFTTAVKDKVSYSINAIVLDPNTTLPAMATEVNKRWLKRVILPAAASFISGLGSAIAETSNTNVSVNGETVSETSTDLDTEEEIGKAVEEAAEKISKIVDKEAKETEVLVRIETGTPIGILFLSPVMEESQAQPSNATQAQGSTSNTVGINTGGINVSSLPQSIRNIPGIESMPMETIQQVLSGNR